MRTVTRKKNKKKISKSSGRRAKATDVNSETLKSQIITIACKHFAQYGFNGTSLKEVAKDAKIANSLINYHFKDKSGLFGECMEPFARGRMEAVLKVLVEPQSIDDLRVRLEIFVDDMISTMVKDYLVFETLEREIRANNPIVVKIFENTMLLAFRAVVAFFEKAKANKLIRSDVDPLICAGMLFSTCDSAKKHVIAKRFFNISFEDPKFRKTYVQQVVSLFMNGVTR